MRGVGDEWWLWWLRTLSDQFCSWLRFILPVFFSKCFIFTDHSYGAALLIGTGEARRFRWNGCRRGLSGSESMYPARYSQTQVQILPRSTHSVMGTDAPILVRLCLGFGHGNTDKSMQSLTGTGKRNEVCSGLPLLVEAKWKRLLNQSDWTSLCPFLTA